MKIKGLILLIALFMSLSLAVAASDPTDVPLFYSAKEIRARIVDEQTGKPIEGAVVVAQWILALASGRGPTLHIAEAVTDEKGQFFIPSWGPKPRQPMSGLTYKSPQILVFKSGYVPAVLFNAPVAEVARLHPDYKTAKTKKLQQSWLWFDGAPNERTQECFWNGLNIELGPFTSTPDEWIRRLENFVYDFAEEDGKDVPHFIQALSVERKYFFEHPVTSREQISVRSFSNKIDRILKNMRGQ